MMKKLLFVAVAIAILFISCEPSKDKKLYDSGKVKEYKGDDLRTIQFPIGGIATGNILLGGRGNIQHIEFFNKIDREQLPFGTYFSIWVKEKDKEPVAKLLEREIMPPYVGWMGFTRNQLSGVPRFNDVVFSGEYPFANLSFKDKEVPVDVALEAYNPYIPLSPEKSGIPCAIFNWKLKNPKNTEIEVSIAFRMFNHIKTKNEKGRFSHNGNVNKYIDKGIFRGVQLTSATAHKDSIDYGDISIVTTDKNVDIQTLCYRGGWWDESHIFWDDFSDDGRIKNNKDELIVESGGSDIATVLVHVKLKPNEEKTIPFYLTWFFPNRASDDYEYKKNDPARRYKNYYSTMFNSSVDVAQYLTKNINELYTETKKFHDIVFNSTYPSYVIDAISSQASSLKTNLVIRNEKGEFYGFEGLSDNTGCCRGTCSHVWNYEQTLAYLFPSLERSMREVAFYNYTTPNGYQAFRVVFPPDNKYWWKFYPAADGQMGNIVRVYREWKLSGDMDWLKKIWPITKAALEFAWKGVGEPEDTSFNWQKENLPLPWDPNKDGVMEGAQHNTYDIEFYGPNTMMGSMYLAALKACSEMADALGEKDKAKEYVELYEKGAKNYDKLLWDKDYYIQKVNVMKGLTVPDRLKSPEKSCEKESCCKGKSHMPGCKKKALDTGEVIPKYQYGNGCLSDQLLGQYLAHVTGLGYVLNKEHVDKAMQSIFKYNFINNMSNFSNIQRVYALNKEAGLLLCTWPKGNRPALPFVYSDEVWTGIEYQVAASLIYSGYIDEGLTVVKAVRDRHRGFNRNPWDEFECGHHYARAMSSWAVMLALSGYHYDGIKHFMAFSPQINKNKFYTFWSCGSGWGSFEVKRDKVILRVEYGNLKLSEFGISKDYGFDDIENITLNSKNVKAQLKNKEALSIVYFDKMQSINKGEELVIVFE